MSSPGIGTLHAGLTVLARRPKVCWHARCCQSPHQRAAGQGLGARQRHHEDGRVQPEWIDGATGPAVGARYRGHVKRNENWPVLYWTTCKITECVPDHVFEFAVIMRDRPVNTWRYEFRATDGGGTVITESFDLGDNLFTKVWRPLGGFLRERRNRRDMLRTLERVKAVAESS